MYRQSAALLVALVPFIVSCGVTPARVSYEKVGERGAKSGTTDGYVFRLRRSIIVISPDEKGVLSASAVPWELTPDSKSYTPMYKISGKDDLRSTTQIKISYLDNKKLPDQLSFSTVDNVSSTIEKIGTVGSAVAPVLAGLVSGTEKGQPTVATTFKPTQIDPGDSDSYSWQQDPLNKDYCVRLNNVIEESTVTIDQYLADRIGNTSRDFPAPSCATAEVEVAACAATRSGSMKAEDLTVMRVTYASSRAILPTPIPSTGTMNFNSICGVNVASSDKEDRTDVLTYIAKMVKSGTDIHAAWKKAKDDKKNAAQ